MVSCKILIIDDDEDDVQILSEALMTCGVDQIHYVFNPMDAFIFLQGIKDKDALPKLIITDHYLPRITGAEFMKDLKEMELYKHIPVIVLANIQLEADIENYHRLGVVDHLTKPNSYEEYVSLAKKITEKIL